MKVSEELNISASQFFDHILATIQYELKEYEKKSVDKEHIKQGLTYTKDMKTKMNQTDHVKVEITKLVAPTEYEATFDSSQGKTVMNYSVEIIDDTHCIVDYEETFIGKDTAKKLNHKLMSVFYGGKSKKRIHYLLKAIEEHILKGE